MNNTNCADVIAGVIDAIRNDVLREEDCNSSSLFDSDPFSTSCRDIKDFDFSDKLFSNDRQEEECQEEQSEYDLKIAQIRERVSSKINPNSCLPQIAIKIKDNYSPNENATQIVLLNGNWDTSGEVPSIVAEMHNVNLDELQVLKGMAVSHEDNTVESSGTGLGGKHMKFDCSLMNLSSTFSPLSSGSSSMAPALSAETPSPLGSDSGIEGDSTDGNLSWLLNFKINNLPPVPDQHISTISHHPVGQTMQSTIVEPPKQQLLAVDSNIRYHAVDELGNMVDLGSKGYAIPTQSDPRKYQTVNSSVQNYAGAKKPPFTYTELIEHALVEKGELTVSGIYQWISDHFPFYKQNDDRWKNSVRHNLSINPHFRKGSKAVHGAGHLWTIAQKDEHQSWQLKRQKMQQFMKSSTASALAENLSDIELANATASILPPMEDSVDHLPHLEEPKNVAVEYVIDMTGGLGVVSLDFFSPPVTHDQVVEECGLSGDYLITDLHPSALELNLGDGEILHTTNLYDDLNFQTFELHTE